MMKLRAGRERDLADIEVFGISREDARIIMKNLDRVERFDPKAALNIKLQLEEWDLV